ncbi:MAG: class I SAM-dependent methyltransferase [Chloroflexota bacterium]
MSEHTHVPEQLYNYYNSSEEYLSHLKSRVPQNVRPYTAAIAEVTNPGGHVIDIGCGTGVSTALLAEQGLKSYGLDLSHPFLRIASENIDNGFVQGDATRLPFAENSVDSVGLNAVIEHVPHVENLLSELTRVIKPQGYLIIFSPNLLSPFTPIKHVGRRILKGEKLNTPFYESIPGALFYALEGFSRLSRKRFSDEPSLEFRRPSLEKTANDYDSVFLSNQVDLEKYLIQLGYQVLSLAQGRGKFGGMLARLFPYYSGGVGIVARRT